MKILVNTPSLKLMGGIANHYKGLRAFWTENVIYNTIGNRLVTGFQSKLQISVFLIHYTSKLDTNEYTGFKKQD